MLNREMEQFIAEHEQEALELLKTLARIPAPSGREEARGQFCRDWLVQQGAEGVFMDAAGNVVYPVEAEGERPLEVFMAHMDVVFPDLEPLPLKEENGRLCCPGVGDDTACLVCLLLAAKYLAGKKGSFWCATPARRALETCGASGRSAGSTAAGSRASAPLTAALEAS